MVKKKKLLKKGIVLFFFFSCSNSTRAESTASPSSRPSAAHRPHIHWGTPRLQRPPPAHSRPHTTSSPWSGPGSRSYVDPFLPCSSSHYMSQTAVAAFSTMQGQSREQQSHGQQSQQQVEILHESRGSNYCFG